MLEVKAGQWWAEKGATAKDERILVRGITSTGQVICEWKGGVASSLRMDYFLQYKEHLPECTGWDWEPEVYPQYRETYEPDEFAFVRLDSPTQFTYVRKDGTEDPPDRHQYALEQINKRTKLTEAEALARIVKTRTIKVHTVAYGYDKLRFVSNVLDTELGGVKRDWEVVQVLRTEEYEVSCEQP